MEDEVETLIMKSFNDVYKLNSPYMGEKIIPKVTYE